jgi:hypothetical protein
MYSVLRAVELGLLPGLSLGKLDEAVGKTRLIQLRNPWGSFEWKGAWADGAKEWVTHPLVRMILRPKKSDDGTFWMPWADFARIFTHLDICDRTTVHDLHLDVAEDLGNCGLCLGCARDTLCFCCCCRGLCTIYGGHRTTGETKSAERGCCGGVACCACARGGPPDPVPA